MYLVLASSLLANVAAAAAAASADCHEFENKSGDRVLAYKKRDVAEFFNHPNSLRSLQTTVNSGAKLQVNGNNLVANAQGVLVDSAQTFDIEVCNQTQDSQKLMWIPKKGPVVTLATMEPFICMTASVVEGETLCFHNDKTFNRHQCQKSAITQKVTGNVVFDPYVHYTELSDITGQREYHGLYSLDPDQLVKYMNMHNVLSSAQRYRALTEGRSLTVATHHGQAAYRESPTEAGHHYWQADYFGQEHNVETSDTRSFTLKAISSSPRVFEIENFLDETEIPHIIELAAQNGYANKAFQDSHIQVSDVYRYDSSMIETVYTHVGAVLQLDPEILKITSLLTEDSSAHKMQVHKCGKLTADQPPPEMPRIHDQAQKQRFASLILFLNDGDGGDLEFPKWQHLAEDPQTLLVAAKKGKAVLVYTMLPDGNTDEFSSYHFTPTAAGQRKISTIHISDDFLEKHVKYEPIPETLD